MFQHRTVRAKNDRQIVAEHAKSAQHGGTIARIVDIEHGIRIAVTVEEILQPAKGRLTFVAEQHRASTAIDDE